MSINESVLAQYTKNTTNTTSGNEKKFNSDEDRMKKYFTTILPKGTKSGEKRIRILPTEDGSTPFKEVMLHEILVDGNWMKLYDPSQEGKPSPLNEVYEGLRMSGDPIDKEQSKTYRSKKFYIVKLIDRDNEQDGPKFWRFKHSFKNDGIFDKIVPYFLKKGDITDAKEGIDLTLMLTLNKANNGKEYTSVTSIMPEDRSPLHEDEVVANDWITDEIKWEDVYSKKPEEYLRLIAEGKTPVYNTNLQKYVDKYEEVEINITGGNTTEVTGTVVTDPQSNDVADDDDDLPF